MSVVNGQFMKFKADEDAMVNHMIYSQNGTVPTAIRELVMNSIDKGADRIEVDIHRKGFRVSDTGTGFASEEDVQKHFRTFGTPHQEGDATFGRFRIGRGQIMSLAKAQWHSNEFRMVTDVRNKGNGMEFFVDPANTFKGCEVSGEFYEPISANDEWSIREDISELVRYLEVPVYLNGQLVNDLTGVEWDYEDDDVKVLWEPAGCHRIKLYSLGVYVKDLPMYRYGLSAHIVTKKAFDLNMARNEISASDPLWQKIDRLVRSFGQKKSREKASGGRLDDYGRSALIQNVLGGESDLVDLMDLSILKDIRGHSVKMNQLRYAERLGRPVAVASTADHKKGERLATRGAALILHEDNLRFWSCGTAEAFFDKLVALAQTSRDSSLVSSMRGIQVETVESLSEGMDDNSEEIDTRDLSPKLQAALHASAQACHKVIHEYIKSVLNESVSPRILRAGKSDVNEAWTDGVSNIWINVELLNGIHKSRYGADYVAGVLIHEYLHAFENSKGHDHDFDFYELFHEVVHCDREGVIGHIGERIRRAYVRKMAQNLQKLPTWATDRYETERLIEAKLTRSGTRVSKAAEIVLKATGFKVDMKPSKALIFAERSRISGVSSKIITKFWQTLKKDGYLSVTKTVAMEMVSRSSIDAYDEQEAAGVPSRERHVLCGEVYHRELTHVLRQFEEALVKWLTDNDQDVMFAKYIRQLEGLSDVLSLLCRDQESDFESFQYEVMEPCVVEGGSKYALKERVRDRGIGLDRSPAVVDYQPVARKAIVEKELLAALAVITDDMERDSMAKKMLSEEMYLAYRVNEEEKQSPANF